MEFVVGLDISSSKEDIMSRERVPSVMPGDKLPNDALVIAHKFGSNGLEYVLCLWYKNAKPEYVSWAIDSNKNTMWGHYGPSFEEAVKKYKLR